MSHQNPEQIEDDIKTVVWNASTQLQTTDERAAIVGHLPVAFLLLTVVPLLGLLLQAFRYFEGFSASSIFPLYVWIGLTAAVPVLWLFYKAGTLRISVDRRRALLTADEQLGASQRITTADEFLKESEPSAFMMAAVDDASSWVERGRDARFEVERRQRPRLRSAFLAVPVSAILLGMVFFLGQFTRQFPDVQVGSNSSLTPLIDVDGPSKPEDEVAGEDPGDEVEEEKEDRLRKPQKQKAVNRQGNANAQIPDTVEDSDGKLSEGETRESQQASNPSSARGTPATSGQPSKSEEQQSPRKKKKKKSKPSPEREKKERKQEEKPSGASAGQGSSKGSDNNAAPSDWASTSQAATPEDENVDDEEDVDDEEEEQESRGGVQPNMRDRRTPVNRDLQIGFGNARPNPDANGRGGPSGQKKSRGVASLVLGVPIPDRVNGQPNKGRIRITQQRITPELEQSDAVNAQDRSNLSGPVGSLHHPQLEPWLQNLVREFFLEQRLQTPLKSQSALDPTDQAPETNNSADNLQTSDVAESDNPTS